MSAEQSTKRSLAVNISLDVWAVIVAFVLAGFVRVGVLKHVPW